jgi:glutamate formiminotransferase/formiminotetrahydrofolate cyclodeaminase
MVSNLTVGKKDYEEVQSKVKELAVRAQALKDEFLKAVDLDTIAFNKVMASSKMKKKTDEQKKLRLKAMEEATKEATLVPLAVLEKCLAALKIAKDVALSGNKNSISDAGVAGLMARAGAEGAYYNVIINLPDIKDDDFKAKITKQAESLRSEALVMEKSIKNIVEKELS